MTRSGTHQEEASGGVPAPDDGLVPSRRQYLELKSGHPGSILLYRMGDFYEAFDEDAKTVARDARITLTSRSFGRNGRVPMAGIPHHALNYYLGRLLAAGHTVAVTEQLSEPGRGLVERGVTRVLTPGTVAEPALLPPGENRYLAAVLPLRERIGLAWVDVSTGEFAVTELGGPNAATLLGEELARLGPAECLVPDDALADLETPGYRTRLERRLWEPERARSALCHRFGARSLEPYGCSELAAATGAAGAILAYLGRTNPALLPLLSGLRTETPGSRVGLDAATRRNLELTRSHGTGGSRGSLLGVLDSTRTSMGARALRRLLGRPLRDLGELRRRQGVVGALVARSGMRAALAVALAGVGDLERLAGRVVQGQAVARDFLALAAALRTAGGIADRLRVDGEPELSAFADGVDPCAEVLALIESAVEEDGGAGARIRPGYSAELDAALDGCRETRAWLGALEGAERERTGIKSLKVGFNKVFGYYIEVTRTNLPLAPPEYVRKQTVATGERFVTAELKEAEARILASDEQIAALERAALARLGVDVAVSAGRLLGTSGRLAFLDALLSLADVAARCGWVAPAIEEGDALEIEGGRHPVVEASLAGEAFIPNDCRLGGNAPRTLLVTGPNMGGKSTYLRQVALIVLLAQVGSWAPAARVRVGLVDRIFTRVGAHDDLARGESTFMVEMVETAAILHQATARSLVILDEVGRGTGTEDGLAIARAVLEDIHHRIGARTLFATHYLELTALAGGLPGIANVHVAALEREGRVVFLYAVRPGAADRAYGIHVARLAGLPPWVAERAEETLAELLGLDRARDGDTTPTDGDVTRDGTGLGAGAATGGSPYGGDGSRERFAAATPDVAVRVPPDRAQVDSARDLLRVAEPPPPRYQPAADASPPTPTERLARELEELDLEGMTPREALQWLFERQERLRDEGRDGVERHHQPCNHDRR